MKIYEWKITMVNGKEYIIKSDKNKTEDFNTELYGIGTGAMNTLNSYNLSERDNNGCKDVIIASSQVCSVEYNFK